MNDKFLFQAFADLSEKLTPLVDRVRDNRKHWIELADETLQQRKIERDNRDNKVNQTPNNNNNCSNIIAPNTYDDVSTSSSDVSISSKIVGKLPLDATQQILCTNYLKHNGSWCSTDNNKEQNQVMDQQ